MRSSFTKSHKTQESFNKVYKILPSFIYSKQVYMYFKCSHRIPNTYNLIDFGSILSDATWCHPKNLSAVISRSFDRHIKKLPPVVFLFFFVCKRCNNYYYHYCHIYHCYHHFIYYLSVCVRLLSCCTVRSSDGAPLVVQKLALHRALTQSSPKFQPSSVIGGHNKNWLFSVNFFMWLKMIPCPITG